MRYLIVGDGRLASHMQHYLKGLSLPFDTWSRRCNTHASLEEKLQASTHVLILLKDDAIEKWCVSHQLKAYPHLTCVHCSGCLVSAQAHSAHPLQTFSKKLYALETYRDIPFFIEAEGPLFEALLPGFPNPHYRIPKKSKAYYHALSVCSNNFTTVVWQYFFKTMEQAFGVDAKHLHPFLKQTFLNLSHDVETALTGPLVRGDSKTLKANEQALPSVAAQNLFKACIRFYQEEVLDEKHSSV